MQLKTVIDKRINFHLTILHKSDILLQFGTENAKVQKPFEQQ